MKSIASPLKMSRLPLVLIALFAPALSQVHAAPSLLRTVVGRVDGQKFGTNVVGEGKRVTFEADSKEEERLLAACASGNRCRVVVTTRAGDVVASLISAEPMPDDAASARPLTQVAETGVSGPSFACEKAQASVELVICRSSELSALDFRLAHAYRMQLNSGKKAADRQTLHQVQREWINKGRAACGIDEACLRAAYKARIDALNGSHLEATH